MRSILRRHNVVDCCPRLRRGLRGYTQTVVESWVNVPLEQYAGSIFKLMSIHFLVLGELILFEHSDKERLFGHRDSTQAWRRWNSGKKSEIEGSVQEIMREVGGQFARQLNPEVGK